MQDELATYVRARYPLVYIVSPEERRVEAAVNAVAKSLDMGVRLWSLVSGFTSPSGDKIQEMPDPQGALIEVGNTSGRTIFVMRDFHPFFAADNPANVPSIRTARELGRQLKSAPKEDARTVVFLAPRLELPEELLSEVVVLEWPLPNVDELRGTLDEVVEALPEAIQENLPEDLAPIVQAARGLTLDEAQNTFARSIVTSRTLDPGIISNEKKQAVSRSGAVEWITPAGGLESIGGLEVLKSWLLERKLGFTDKAKEYGLPEPKGMLCVGPPGTGKSLSTIAAAVAWGIPIVRATADRMSGGIVGESEDKTRKVFKICEAIAPCVLHMDEIEKLFAGAGGSGDSDSGVGKKVFGMVLTWMAEKKAPVFVAATANDVDGLPPELLRKGRFDEIFYVGPPNNAERNAIWDIHISKRDRKPDAFDMKKLVTQSDLFTGAEIEAVFESAMFRAFAQDEEVSTQHVLTALSETQPLAKTAGEKIEAVIKWAQGRARDASIQDKTNGSSAGRFGSLEL
jgi:hypothetical protein